MQHREQMERHFEQAVRSNYPAAKEQFAKALLAFRNKLAEQAVEETSTGQAASAALQQLNSAFGLVWPKATTSSSENVKPLIDDEKAVNTLIGSKNRHASVIEQGAHPQHLMRQALFHILNDACTHHDIEFRGGALENVFSDVAPLLLPMHTHAEARGL